MSKTAKADVTTNLLLSLAWLGELDKHQVQRLCVSNRSIQTVENTLRALRKDGLVEPRAWHRVVDGIPHEQPSLWALTKQGHDRIAGHDQYPPKPAPVGPKRLIGHSYRTVETIIRLIELARPDDLSGLYVQFEVRLDPTQARPRMDALVILQTGGDFNRSDLVPWSKDPAIADEARCRCAIESDNDTEPLAVIEGKARVYGAVYRDPAWHQWWQEQWGPPPCVIWVVPDRPRLEAVHTAWQRTWPGGAWLLTTDRGLTHNTWLRYTKRTAEWGNISGFSRLAPQGASHATLTAPASTAPPPAHPQVLPTPHGHAPVSGQYAPVPAAPAPATPPSARTQPLAAPVAAPPPALQTPVSRTPPGPAALPPTPALPRTYPPAIILSPLRYTHDPAWDDEPIPWAFICKAGISALLVSSAITLVLLFGVPIWTWTQAWARTLLWVVAGSTCIGLVARKRDTWWLGDQAIGRTLNRGTVLLGIMLLVLPTGFGRWTWATFRPVPTDVSVGVGEPSAPATAPLTVPPPTPSLVPTPATCGQAIVAAPRGLRLRAHPGTDAAILAKLPHQTRVELLCEVHVASDIRWVHVRAGDREGWVAEREGTHRHLVQP